VGSEYPFTDASIIYAYSRTQAIEDGVLIDVTPTAKEGGIRYPVALSAAVWASVVATPEVARRRGESDEGRLWDVVSMLRHAISRSRADTVHFRFSRPTTRAIESSIAYTRSAAPAMTLRRSSPSCWSGRIEDARRPQTDAFASGDAGTRRASQRVPTRTFRRRERWSRPVNSPTCYGPAMSSGATIRP
jgi:hypothetical protein